MREGDFSDLLALARPTTIRNPFTNQPFPGNRIPAELRSAASRNAQERLYPLPNFGSPELTVANFRGGFPRDRRVDKINSRVDYLFSERHTVYARFGYTRSLANELAGGFLPAAFIGGHAQTLNRAPQGTLSSTYTLAPNLINEAKAGVARTRVSTGGPVSGQELVDLIGIQGLKRQPRPGSAGLRPLRLHQPAPRPCLRGFRSGPADHHPAGAGADAALLALP